MTKEKDIERWSTQKSSDLYGITNWGADYFGVNEQGHVTVTPDGPNGPKIDLFDLVQSVIDRDIDPPVLFRFNGILRHRVRTMVRAFQSAIDEHSYQGRYRPAYPIKVNQQRHVLDVLLQFGSECGGLGLEVGSKPELIAVLALHDNPEALLLCNGYKDEGYIELALMSRKVGRRPVIIIEKFSELSLVLRIAAKLGIEPEIGFRIRNSAKGAGRWERSGGERAKFGLTVGEILQCVNELRERDMLSCVKLVHSHIGSQLTSIAALRVAIKELTQIYVQLRRICPNLSFIDVGGGLGVDYDGSKTAFESSMNYTLEEYARDVVWVITEICSQGNVPHPDIITESGRATVAYHSVLVFNTLGIANTFTAPCDPQQIMAQSKEKIIQNMAQLLLEVSPKNCHEVLHDTMGLRSDMLEAFNLGLLSIEERAMGDECYWALLTSVSRAARELHYVPEDLERLPSLLSDTYFCNFSVFQSIPDNWAIEQIFPLAPIHRLNEEPTRPVVLADITCDSDGKIDRFADLRDVKRYLPAHTLKNGDPYYLAVFLVGAYQEILGDLHNLFGDTNAVHIDVDSNGQVEITSVVHGDTIAEVLQYVQYERNDLCSRWRSVLETAVNRGSLTALESGEMYKKFARAFDGYTYLSLNGPQ